MSQDPLNYPTESTVKVNPLGDTKLFQSIKVGNNTLQNRIVFAPATRYRTSAGNVPSDLQRDYYDQRTKSPGSLVTAEGTFVSERTGVHTHSPAIYTEQQVKAWKKITDKVHENKSFIATQLWGLGRVTVPQDMVDYGLKEVVAPSAIYHSEDAKAAFEQTGIKLRALTTEEVQDLIVNDFTKAAKNAIAAGFDYLELHAANGYLLDTFLHPSSNQRTDQYGGSIENRARFVLELVDHLSKIVGPEKLAIRFSPWAVYNEVLGADEEVSPYATFGYIIKELQKRAEQGSEIAYISLVEPRVSGAGDVAASEQRGDNEFIGDIWKGVLIRAGNFSYDAPEFTDLRDKIADDRTLVGFARYIISNPDFVERLRHGHSLVPYHNPVFYTAKQKWGYTTYKAYGDNTPLDREAESKITAQALA